LRNINFKKNLRSTNDKNIKKKEKKEESNDLDSYPSFKFHIKPAASILSTYTQSVTPEPDQGKDNIHISSLKESVDIF
jgi:UbiD family decarboxylase